MNILVVTGIVFVVVMILAVLAYKYILIPMGQAYEKAEIEHKMDLIREYKRTHPDVTDDDVEDLLNLELTDKDE